MKHTYLGAAQRITGWVKNARSFAEAHPLVMGTAGVVAGALLP